jgi:hypothetical protein
VSDQTAQLLKTFGAWYKCSDEILHYALGAAPLCGKNVELVREVYGSINGNGPTFPGETLCAECKRMNVVRWAQLYPESVPLPELPSVDPMGGTDGSGSS